MLDRKKFDWDVVLQDQSGKVHNVRFSNYWSPEKVNSTDIGIVAAAEASTEHKMKFAPISAALAA